MRLKSAVNPPQTVATNRIIDDRIRTGLRPNTLASGTQTMFPSPRRRTLSFGYGQQFLVLDELVTRCQHTAMNLVKSLNGRGFSGNHRSHMGRAGASDAEAKLHTKAYNDTVAKQANFLHGAQFNGSAGSDVGSGNLTTRSTYLPFCCAVLCSEC